ncbi:DUF2683 family protein [Pedobacter sp. UBA4863]
MYGLYVGVFKKRRRSEIITGESPYNPDFVAKIRKAEKH